MGTESSYKPFGIFRMFLALLVAEAHAHGLLGLDRPQNSAWNAQGIIAVMIFFVLSGFVITEALNIFYKDRIGRFLLNRLLRLFPPYCAALLVAIGLFGILHALDLMPHEVECTFRIENENGRAVLVHKSMPASDIFSIKNVIANILIMPMIYGVGSIGMFPSYSFFPYILGAEC